MWRYWGRYGTVISLLSLAAPPSPPDPRLPDRPASRLLRSGLFIYTIFQEGDIFSSTASLPYDPLTI